jgi:hypothetical protein
MRDVDLLHRLLQSADAADNPPPVAADLPQRVRQRRAAQAARARRAAVAAFAVSTVLLLSFVTRRENSSIPETPDSPANSTELAEIRAKADALSAEIAGLERAIAEQQQSSRLAELAREYQSLLANRSSLDPADLAIDQAAAMAICQGDFLWQELDAREAAANAYRSVVAHFPDSRWAVVANQKLNRLQMN